MNASASNTFDPREFRNALGCFATGVTVVTTCGSAGEPVGLTANSFNSVSLQPPLVLWSLARDSLNLPAFSQAEHWVVHILAADQEAVSKRFASRGTDKFAGLEFDRGLGNAPLLHGCAARFQCRTAFQYEGGDHVIFVGEVVRFDRLSAPPLLFHDGRYALALRKVQEMEPPVSQLTGDFSDDFMGYLLGRGHFNFYRKLRAGLQSVDISNDEYFVLTALLRHESFTASQLNALVGYLLSGDLTGVLDALQARNFIEKNPSAEGEASFEVAAAGREVALHMFAESKAYEAQVIERFGAEDTFILKSLLRKLMAALGVDSREQDRWS